MALAMVLALALAYYCIFGRRQAKKILGDQKHLQLKVPQYFLLSDQAPYKSSVA
jgi:hypothetical protein